MFQPKIFSKHTNGKRFLSNLKIHSFRYGKWCKENKILFPSNKKGYDEYRMKLII